MFRVLRPGGKLLIIDGRRDCLWGWLVYDVVVTWLEGGVHHCSAKRFRQLYRNAGFQELKQIKRGWLAPFLMTEGAAKKDAELPYRKAA